MKQILLTFALFFSTYYPIAAQNHPFLPFQQGKLVGFKDSTDKIRIPPTFDYALPFSDGLALVRKGNDIYFINEQGKKAFPLPYDMADPFENGLSRVRIGDKYGMIDTKGKTVLRVEYDAIENYGRKYIYQLFLDDKSTFWNANLRKELLPYGYYNLQDINIENKIGYLYTEGQTIIFNTETGLLQYSANIHSTNINSYKNGFSIRTADSITDEAITKLYNQQGNLVQRLSKFQEDTIFAPVFRNNQIHWYNNSGKLIFKTSPKQYAITDYYSRSHFSEDRLAISKDSLCGYIDTLGNEIIPAIYKKTYSYSGGIARVILTNNKEALIDKWGKFIIDPTLYDSIGIVSSIYTENRNRFIVKKGDKYGVFNKEGKLLLPIEYPKDHIRLENTNEFILFTKNGKWGAIDTKGKTLFSNEYETLYSDYYWVLSKKGKYWIADENRIKLLEGKIAEGRSLPNKWGYFFIEKGSKIALYDCMGRELIPPHYDMIFEEGPEIMMVGKNGKNGLVQTNGKLVVPTEYRQIYSIGYKQFIVMKDSLWGLIDDTNTLLIPYQYQSMYYSFYQKNTLVARKNGKWGTMTLTGTPIIPFEYDGIEFLSPNLVAVGILNVNTGYKWKFITPEGVVLLPDEYNGYCHSSKTIISGGNELFMPEAYTKGCRENNNYWETIEVRKNGKIGKIDMNAKIVLPPIYDYIIYNNNNTINATLNNKTYHYDLNGNCLDCPKD